MRFYLWGCCDKAGSCRICLWSTTLFRGDYYPVTATCFPRGKLDRESRGMVEVTASAGGRAIV